GMLSSADWPKLTQAAGKLSEAPVFIDDSPSLSILELRAKARRLKARHGIELLIVDYEQGRETLIRKVLGKKDLLGIGPKAADCVLLFSCDKDEAFPIDVWITRAVEKYYKTVVGRELARKLKSRLSGRQNFALGTYDALSSRLRSYFGTYAGYAQQYLFLLARATLAD
ncbi:MAG: hypothetical protein HYZ12_02090, partial [Thaumarchaeota archaeon]|nr:hypothetical protein [Nitrososphaerota archaeon]